MFSFFFFFEGGHLVFYSIAYFPQHVFICISFFFSLYIKKRDKVRVDYCIVLCIDTLFAVPCETHEHTQHTTDQISLIISFLLRFNKKNTVLKRTLNASLSSSISFHVHYGSISAHKHYVALFFFFFPKRCLCCARQKSKPKSNGNIAQLTRARHCDRQGDARPGRCWCCSDARPLHPDPHGRLQHCG